MDGEPSNVTILPMMTECVGRMVLPDRQDADSNALETSKANCEVPTLRGDSLDNLEWLSPIDLRATDNAVQPSLIVRVAGFHIMIRQ